MISTNPKFIAATQAVWDEPIERLLTIVSVKHNLLTQNSKIIKGGKRVFNFSLPAYKSITGRVVCPYAGKCVMYCYAQKGFYSFSNVAPAHERNFRISQLAEFKSLMIDEIRHKKAVRIRIHDSGDFYSMEYLHKWISIARECPQALFYAYSKSILLFKKVKLPRNFRVIYSYGGTHDALINPQQDRHASIFKSLADLRKAGYENASVQDSIAATTLSRKIGLVIH
jgi:hypothetical protein